MQEIQDPWQRVILVTGGAGFIGSHLVRLLVNKYPDYHIVVLDSLTYAGNMANLADCWANNNLTFTHADIRDLEQCRLIFDTYGIDGVFHLAAESHVDNSIKDPRVFAETNVLGTLTLLQAAKEAWEGDYNGKMFLHVSTDEVYGALKEDCSVFNEETKYDPHSPYAASKAASDHFVRAYYDTYGLPTIITHCCNNYGPNQFPEKLIPLCLSKIQHNEPIPVYGDGRNIRDWLYVEDHVKALDLAFHNGTPGETYDIGDYKELRNITLVKTLIKIADRMLGREEGASEKLITFVGDRPGHDWRYAIDSSKIRNELGWTPETTLEDGLEKTVAWYFEHRQWLEDIGTGKYAEYNKEYC